MKATPTPSSNDPPSSNASTPSKAKIASAKLPDPKGQSLMTKFFNVIAGADKFKHFDSLFEKFEWERKERQRKEEERYVYNHSILTPATY